MAPERQLHMLAAAAVVLHATQALPSPRWLPLVKHRILMMVI